MVWGGCLWYLLLHGHHSRIVSHHSARPFLSLPGDHFFQPSDFPDVFWIDFRYIFMYIYWYVYTVYMYIYAYVHIYLKGSMAHFPIIELRHLDWGCFGHWQGSWTVRKPNEFITLQCSRIRRQCYSILCHLSTSTPSSTNISSINTVIVIVIVIINKNCQHHK